MRTRLLLAFLFTHSILSAQTNLFTNSSFESNPIFSGWLSNNANGDLWGGPGDCTAPAGSNYIWSGDQNEVSGINNLSEQIYQQVSIPANATAAEIRFEASMNTSESTTSIIYDQFELNILSSGGSFLESLGYLSNVQADAGITNCQTWTTYVVPVPANYFGQTIRFSFDFETDGSASTIFRLDNIRCLVTSPTSCNYALSTNSYNLTGSQAGTFSNVASVTTTNNCSWLAQVTSGSSWLSTSSSGTGNGNISITVAENTTFNSRTGTINVEGQNLTITQPAFSCDYSLSQATYNCPDHTAANWINIALVNVENGCAWDATVVEGTNWMVCNSDGNGNGTISIDVTANNTNQDRTGSIVVEGETLLVVQPVDFKLTGVNEMNETSISIFPNPTNDYLTINAGLEFLNSNYQIADWTGRIVLNGFISETNHIVDLNSLSSGAYFITVKNADHSMSEKIIKL